MSAVVSYGQEVDFRRDVRPILSEKCFHCHGPDSATRESDLRLDVAESAAAVLAHTSDEPSQLLNRVLAEDPDEQMPPADSLKQLTNADKDILRRWIEAGGSYENHWAYSPPSSPTLPDTIADPWCQNPIDAFILEQLQTRRVKPAESASASTLARRIALDLTGLPPRPDDVQNFCNISQRRGLEVACQQWIDQLMSSPRYGEHMALPWLEAARYADTDGYQNDRYRYQDAWRDWVLKAFNDNMPYDQFIIEQLAGDLLPNATLWQQVATGFGRNHRINSEDGSIPEEWLTENVVDRVDTLGTVFLGMTIGCARCHDHKYDPISQREYYELFAYFNNIAEHGVGPNNGNSPPFVELPKSWPHLSPAEDRALVPEPVKLRRSREEAGNGLRRPQAGPPGTVMVMHELDEPRETYVLIRGQYNAPDKSQRLEPNVPAAFASVNTRKDPPRNRLELAQWLVAPENPLTARVAVNRLWQQHFGIGLVESSENFGSQGTLPSHPELLDWLATELINSQWDLRLIQRLILTSATYQQSSRASAQQEELDPHNRWLGRGPRQRVSPFILRDQALAASGLLVEKLGGPSVKPYMPENIWSAISNNDYKQDTGENLFRRSIYTYWRRTIPPPTMMNFDSATREVCTVRTEPTNTPLQALTLLNNKTFVETAKKLAERMLTSSSESLDQQITYGFLLCTAREPNLRETKLLQQAHNQFLTEYQADASAAKQLLDQGEAPYDRSLPAAQFAAMTMTASLILNLDETVSKE
jgi:hypothetical protein